VTRVKICGVNSAAAFDAACDAGADWIGFVFFAGSPRCVTPAQAAALSARRSGGPARVGLFVEPADIAIEAALAALQLDVLQIYDLPPRVADIAARFGLPVWRAIPVMSRAELPATCAPAAAALIEPRPPAGATRPGGNAQLLDWSLLGGWRPDFPWLLAGGLTPENVAAAIAATGAPAVDVSSGVESSPGVKSADLIAAFVAAARVGQSKGK
jgi:phosphoribosylanthranilate isomerase